MPDVPAQPGPPILETQPAPPSWESLSAAAPAAGPRFTVGGALSRTLRIWWSHVWVFTGMSLVVYAPVVVASAFFFAWATGIAGGRPPPQAADVAKGFAGLLAAAAVTMVLSVVQIGAVTYATVQHLHGERARIGRMLAVGLRRGLPVVGVGFVVSIVSGAGMLLLVVPGLMFMVAACVAVPAAVVERRGVGGALERSFVLTRGSRWPLFATGAVVMVVLWILSMFTQLALTVAAVTLPRAQAVAVPLVGSQLGNALFSVIPGIAIAVCYHDLRLAKEGVDTAELAKVFE